MTLARAILGLILLALILNLQACAPQTERAFLDERIAAHYAATGRPWR